jgi:phosphinothricin acetyltransferase
MLMTAPAALSIRHASEADLGAINRIYNHEIEHGTATWDVEPWTAEQRRAWWAEHSDPLQPVIVAEDGTGVVGFAYLTLMSRKAGWRFTREDTIYIDERCRGQGVGAALLGALLEEARAIGVRLVVASITSTNEVSIRLHRRFGFELVGTLRNAGYKFGEWMDTTYVQVDLGVASSE